MKRSLLYRTVCGCLTSHNHTRQEGMTGMFQAKENENYGHPHQEGLSLATVQYFHISHWLRSWKKPLLEFSTPTVHDNFILSSHPCTVIDQIPLNHPIQLTCFLPSHHLIIQCYQLSYPKDGGCMNLQNGRTFVTTQCRNQKTTIICTTAMNTCTHTSSYTYQTQTTFQQVLCFTLLYDTNYWVVSLCMLPTHMSEQHYIILHQYGSHHIRQSI